VVRAYNGGPGGAEKESTEHYWSKYQKAKQVLSAGFFFFPGPPQLPWEISAYCTMLA